MKIFTSRGQCSCEKINFVDENNVLLGYSMDAQCCEDFGWFIADTIKDERQDLSNEIELDLKDFIFDTKFFKENLVENESGGTYENIAVFRIFNEKQEKYIHLYNYNNGYYSHGFELNVGGEVIKKGDL